MMEREIKFTLGRAEDFASLTFGFDLGSPREIQMESVYFDTEDDLLEAQKCGLRLRMENDVSVCCLKLPVMQADGIFTRREYECLAKNLAEGLATLPRDEANSPLLAEILGKPFKEICRVHFLRNEYLLKTTVFLATVCLDEGFVEAFGKREGLLELEIEYQTGDLKAYTGFCEQFQEENGLKIEMASKLLRGIRLKNSEKN